MNYQELQTHCDEWFGEDADKKQPLSQIIAAMVDLLRNVGCPLENDERKSLISIHSCTMQVLNY